METDLYNIVVSAKKIKRKARQDYLKLWKRFGNKAHKQFQMFYCTHHHLILSPRNLKNHRCKTRLDETSPCERLLCYEVKVDESAGKRDSDVVKILSEYQYAHRSKVSNRV